jgi:adenylosuccinate synthase
MKKAYIIVDLCYGDAGKGTIVDFLSRQSPNSLIVRYNGGAQAAHNVVTKEGLHHTFAQFGSGTLFPTTKTHLSRFMLVNPYALNAENDHLVMLGCNDALGRLTIEEDALITTPFQQAANRIKESIYGEHLSGSCGKGIWETVSDAEKFSEPIRIKDFRNHRELINKLKFIQSVKRIETANLIKDKVINDPTIRYEIDLLEDTYNCELVYEYYINFLKKVKVVDSTYLDKAIQESSQVIFEGAQGILLDPRWGFSPYTTWTDITPRNVYKLFSYKKEISIETIGIFRTYFHRHGPGPFVTQDMSVILPELHNDNNRWQKHFRTGYFDFVAAKYAIGCCRMPDSLAITHLDYLPSMEKKVCIAYEYTGNETLLLPKYFKLSSKRTITEIIPQENIPLDKEQQARMLFEMKPIFIDYACDFIKLIELDLGIKVKITSSGMTAEDKKFIKEK